MTDTRTERTDPRFGNCRTLGARLWSHMRLRWRVPADLDALRRAFVSRRARRLGAGSTDPLDHDERGPDWWRHPGAGRALPAHTPQTGLPGKMPYASGFHPAFLA